MLEHTHVGCGQTLSQYVPLGRIHDAIQHTINAHHRDTKLVQTWPQVCFA